MFDIEYDPDIDWLYALRLIRGKGYRRTANGNYETFVSDHCRTVNLGTYQTIQDAQDAVFDFRVSRLINGVKKYGLCIDDSKVFMLRYLAFPNGLIFNIHGDIMRGAVDRNGYIHGIFNEQNIQHHRIIATLFCQRGPGEDYVNHVDGDKQNNSANNLEWVTRSENTRHSYRIGLQKTVSGNPVFSDSELQYIKNHCLDYYKDVAAFLERNEETVRKYMYKYRKEIYCDQD